MHTYIFQFISNSEKFLLTNIFKLHVCHERLAISGLSTKPLQIGTSPFWLLPRLIYAGMPSR